MTHIEISESLHLYLKNVRGIEPQVRYPYRPVGRFELGGREQILSSLHNYKTLRPAMVAPEIHGILGYDQPQAAEIPGGWETPRAAFRLVWVRQVGLERNIVIVSGYTDRPIHNEVDLVDAVFFLNDYKELQQRSANLELAGTYDHNQVVACYQFLRDPGYPGLDRADRPRAYRLSPIDVFTMAENESIANPGFEGEFVDLRSVVPAMPMRVARHHNVPAKYVSDVVRAFQDASTDHALGLAMPASAIYPTAQGYLTHDTSIRPVRHWVQGGGVTNYAGLQAVVPNVPATVHYVSEEGYSRTAPWPADVETKLASELELPDVKQALINGVQAVMAALGLCRVHFLLEMGLNHDWDVSLQMFEEELETLCDKNVLQRQFLRLLEQNVLPPVDNQLLSAHRYAFDVDLYGETQVVGYNCDQLNTPVSVTRYPSYADALLSPQMTMSLVPPMLAWNRYTQYWLQQPDVTQQFTQDLPSTSFDE